MNRNNIASVPGVDVVRVVGLMSGITRTLMLKDGRLRPDSCVAATLVGIDVFLHFGIQAKPLPMWMSAWNAEYAALQELPEAEALASQLAAAGRNCRPCREHRQS